VVRALSNLLADKNSSRITSTKAGLSGGDIFYDQKYRTSRRPQTPRSVLRIYKASARRQELDASSSTSRGFFSPTASTSAISSAKICPGGGVVSGSYLGTLAHPSDAAQLPLEGKSVARFHAKRSRLFFRFRLPRARRQVNLAAGIDNVNVSANNF